MHGDGDGGQEHEVAQGKQEGSRLLLGRRLGCAVVCAAPPTPACGPRQRRGSEAGQVGQAWQGALWNLRARPSPRALQRSPFLTPEQAGTGVGRCGAYVGRWMPLWVGGGRCGQGRPRSEGSTISGGDSLCPHGGTVGVGRGHLSLLFGGRAGMGSQRKAQGWEAKGTSGGRHQDCPSPALQLQPAYR